MPETPKITFNDKCSTDAFVHSFGQTIELIGPHYKGSLEVLVDRSIADFELFHLYPDGDLSKDPVVVMASDISDVVSDDVD